MVKITGIILAISLLLVNSSLNGQTLFATPDTTPNYSRYQNIEECWQAALRVNNEYRTRLDSIWRDTLFRETKEQLGFLGSRRAYSLSKRTEDAIQTARVCLNKFNADTVAVFGVEHAAKVVKILLIAHRDDDAARFAQRVFDSLLKESEGNSDRSVRQNALKDYKKGHILMMAEYSRARPVRPDVVKQYYRRLAPTLVGDSLYYRIDAALAMAGLGDKLEDSTLTAEMMGLALRLNDSTPVKERLRSPGAGPRLKALEHVVVTFTKDEALDSLAISTTAYNLWDANTVHRRVYGGELKTREQVKPKKFPNAGGAFYYVADNMSPEIQRNGIASYTNKGAVPKGEFPISGRINYFRSMSSFCHMHTMRRVKKEAYYKTPYCVKLATDLRQFKRDFPYVEITGIGRTYGTVGFAAPMTPAQEADTLAKMFLGNQHIPARLIVEATEVFHLGKPDGRRIDIRTPISDALGFDVLNGGSMSILTDKEGNMLGMPTIEDRSWAKRFFEVLRDRQTPKD